VSLAASAIAQVEVLDGAPRWSYGMLAANFARIELLVTWYGCNPDRYLAAIEQGIEDPDDREFLLALKERLVEDGSLLHDMRRIVGEFASRFPS
jgi:hypothetical protein